MNRATKGRPERGPRPAPHEERLEERLEERFEERFDRLRATATLEGDAFERWRLARIALVGAGHLGSRVGIEIARSGAGVRIYDPQRVSPENLGTQCHDQAGRPKADSLRDACHRIRAGSASSAVVDARHVAVGEWEAVDLIIDCTDDARLEWHLTEISNGLGIPMLRLAVDGSGRREFGRVQASHGGGGAACRLCGKSVEDLTRTTRRTPCPAGDVERPATRAGNAVGMATAGIGLLQAMRLLGGNRPEDVLDRHVLVDLDAFRTVAITENRSADCLSGHVRWRLVRATGVASLRDVFRRASDELNGPVDSIEPFSHPIHEAAVCPCGRRQSVRGTEWADPPRCPACGERPVWQWHTAKARWSRDEAERAGILSDPLDELGVPSRGALFVARRAGHPPLRLVATTSPDA